MLSLDIQNWVITTLIQYSHEPFLIYTGIAIFMILSSLGMPIPEEAVILTAGLMTFS